jgi:hypothetical protein
VVSEREEEARIYASQSPRESKLSASEGPPKLMISCMRSRDFLRFHSCNVVITTAAPASSSSCGVWVPFSRSRRWTGTNEVGGVATVLVALHPKRA